MKLDSMLKRVEDFFETEEGQAWIEAQKIKNEIHYARMEKMDQYFSSLSDEDRLAFIDKLISKHDEAYRDRIYNKGIEPHPNHLMNLLFQTAFEFATDQAEPLDEFAQMFASETVNYRGYFFGHIYGQGTVARIHSSQKNLIFQL
jgi:hypothetical protein